MARTASRSSSERGGVAAALRELLALGDRAGWVLSCYQKLEPGDRLNDKYRIKLKNRLRGAAERLDVLGYSHAEREGIRDALGRIEEFFSHPSNLEGSRGLAVFVAARLFRVVPLPYVLRSRVIVDRTAVVGELVALSEEGTRLLAVVADRRSARFFDVGLLGVTELEGLAAPESTRGARFHGPKGSRPGVDFGGAGEYRFQNRMRDEKDRHLARVAEAAVARLRSGAYDGLVVGGIGVAADALTAHLHPSVRDRVVGAMQMAPRKVTGAEVRERAMELLADRAQAHAESAVEEFRSLLPNRWAVDGVGATLQALARGQVRTLLVDHDARMPGYRLSKSGRLSESLATHRGEGEALPIADLLDDAMEDALRQRAHVAVVRGVPARRFDRLAGILRFKLGT
jgi:peptide subunit release factor 1 (eRF1)